MLNKKIVIVILVFLIVILAVKIIYQSQEHFDNKLPIIKGTDHIFIHIPKNGGTSFCEKYLDRQAGHRKANTYSIPQLKKKKKKVQKSSRIMLCYKYFKSDKHIDKKYGHPEHHEYQKSTLNL